MRVTLEIVSGPDTWKKIQLESGQVMRVGRTAQADLSIEHDTFMSGVHFALECERKICRIRDLKSRNGTSLNGKVVEEEIIRDGDKIFAGQTAFAVHVESDAPVVAPHPSAQMPATTPVKIASLPTPLGEESDTLPVAASPPSPPVVAPLAVGETAAIVQEEGQEHAAPPRSADAQEELSSAATPEERLLHILRGQPEPLFALLDAAREPKVLELLRSSEEEYQSLYEGKKGEELTAFAPYLVRLPAQSSLLETLVRDGWGKSWGVYLTCDKPFDRVRRYLRQFLLVKAEDNREMYFRFYDPRVLRVFLPTCTMEETVRFFGSIRCYLMEAGEPETLLKFTVNERGAKQEEVLLSAPEHVGTGNR